MAKHASQAVIEQTNNSFYGATGFTAFIGYWANYVNFSGRTARREYWWNFLFEVLIIVGIEIVSLFAMIGIIARDPSRFMDTSNVMSLVGGLLGLVILWAVIVLVTLLPGITIAVRRFRDAGVHWGYYLGLQIMSLVGSGLTFSGKTTVGYILTIIAGIAVFVITLLPSKNPPTDTKEPENNEDL